MWRGHLAVVVDDSWLLDPTLDQANKKEWPRSMRVGPLAIQLSKNFWAEQRRSNLSSHRHSHQMIVAAFSLLGFNEQIFGTDKQGCGLCPKNASGPGNSVRASKKCSARAEY
jgi:hypothetical protein